MTAFEEEIIINAPVTAVWEVLADIGTIARWNPGLRSSETINAINGLGAQRMCVISRTQWLTEEVVAFRPQQEITFQITRTTLPFKVARIHFGLSEVSSGTRVTVSPRYSLKYGILGTLLDAFMVRSAYRKGMIDLLEGLKTHLEKQSVAETPMA